MAVAAAALVACGDAGGDGAGGGGGSGGGASGPIACGDHPLDCPAGQTCWFGSAGFACAASGAGKEGDTCAPTVGDATCGDGLLCIAVAGEEGACARLCDPTIDATCGEDLCTLVETKEGFQTHVCTAP
jgi:hypothetical protein